MPDLRFFDGTDSYPDRADTLDSQWIGPGAASTVTVITSQPSSAQSGVAFTISGTVKTSAGANVTGGTVQIQKLVGSTWTNVSTAVAVSAGAWSRTGITITATTQFRAVYSGYSTSYLASTSATKTTSLVTIQTFTKTYACTGSASYQSDGDKRSGIVELYQGYYSSTNGNQRSVAAFADATIRADLVGATITKVELYLNALHWGDSGGGTAIIGTIATSGCPASNPSTADYNRATQAWSSKTGAKWITLPNAIGNDFKSGAAKAILLGPGPSTSTLAYYGYFAGNGQTGEPQLRITYTKAV